MLDEMLDWFAPAITIVNANNLFDYVINSLREDKIPITNLISNLSDSTNYMRGKIAGFESLLRKEAPHLLDINDDNRHHFYNASKKIFCHHSINILNNYLMI